MAAVSRRKVWNVYGVRDLVEVDGIEPTTSTCKAPILPLKLHPRCKSIICDADVQSLLFGVHAATLYRSSTHACVYKKLAVNVHQ
jgi:hypothetical protein